MNNKSLNNLIEKLKKYEQVKAVYLFGSQINGRAREDSDVDIAIIADTTRKKELEISNIADNKFEITIFKRVPLILQFRILKGQLLFCRDDDYLNKIKFEVFRRYLDFAPFIKRFYMRKINANIP